MEPLPVIEKKYIPPAMRPSNTGPWIGTPPPMSVKETLTPIYYLDHLTGGVNGIPERVYGDYAVPSLEVVWEDVEKKTNNCFEKTNLIHPEDTCLQKFDSSKSSTTVTCQHRVRAKSLDSRCELCTLQEFIGDKIKLYSTNVHPKTNGRDKIYRWYCTCCSRDLFASKDQIKHLANPKKFRANDSMWLFISPCEYSHSWSNLLPEYMQQIARRVFEVVTGFPSDDAITTSSLVCYNSNVSFAIYMPDAFTYNTWSTQGNMVKMYKEAINVCTENAKHLMIVERFRYDLDSYMKTEAFITCLYNFLLSKKLLQFKYMPRKHNPNPNPETVYFGNGVTYHKEAYIESLNTFVYMVTKIMQKQVDSGILYNRRSELMGNSEFVINCGEFY